VGYGRSGSTIIGSALGSHQRLFNAGELLWLPRQIGDAECYCSCGDLLGECEFWGAVTKKLVETCGRDAMSKLRQLSEQFDSGRWTWLRARRAIAAGSAEAKDYAALNFALYDAISETAGAEIVVDTSKLPARALLLSHAEASRFRVMHLIRGHRAAIASLKKKYSKDPRAGVPQDLGGRGATLTSLAWLKWNLECEALAARMAEPDFQRIRYEELITDPKRGLSGIAEFLRIEPDGFSTRIDLRAQHIFAGNRLRMQTSQSLEPRKTLPENLTQRERLVGDAVTALGRWYYGW